MILKTEFNFDGAAGYSTFDGHEKVKVVGMTGIESHLDAWSPPHLMLSALESCFFLTFKMIAEKMRAPIKSYTSYSEAEIASPDGEHKEFSKITIYPKVEFQNEDDKKRLNKLIEIAHDHCIVSRAIKIPVEVTIQ